MYFDENILKIIYKIPLDVDIEEIRNQYLLITLEAGLNALVVFESKNKPESMEFIENSVAFKDELSEEEPDFEDLLHFLEKLQRDTNFSKIYNEYLDEINQKLISDVSKKDPQVITEINDYLRDLDDAVSRAYIESLITIVN